MSLRLIAGRHRSTVYQQPSVPHSQLRGPCHLATLLRPLRTFRIPYSCCCHSHSLPPSPPTALVRHLPGLKEVSLYGHRTHDFAQLRRAVNIVRIMVS